MVVAFPERIAKSSVLCFVFFCMTVSVAPKSHSDGIIIPPPEVRIAIKYHRVNVNIDNQIATTKVDQVFINQSHREIEGTYIFPLSPGVVMTRFVMYVDGVALQAEFLDSEQARKIYEDIVRQRRDPALLEYIGRGVFRARVFPIPPRGEKRIQLEYSEVLPYDAGLCKYSYPLNTEKFSSEPLQEVEVAVDLSSHVAIKSIWSPSHENSIVVDRQGDHFARIVYADENITPDIDFVLYYTISEEDFGLNLMTYRNPPDDGFYVLMAAPEYEVSAEEVVSKNVIFVFDTSGSMAGNKIRQAREALEFCVNKLNKRDQFNIIDFGTNVRKLVLEPVTADETEIRSALGYIARLDATGGTDINRALMEALGQVSLATNPLSMIIFLTDGIPTLGVQSNQEIIKNVVSANEMGARLFVFGVGYDVNTHLLDELARENAGISSYVRPEEDIEVLVSTFFAKVSNPVLSDVELDFGFINTVDRYPTQFPDLFAGSQLKEFGRYRNFGDTTITLSGVASGTVAEFSYPAQFLVENTENDFIPRIWAARKIGYLTDEIRRNGETVELVQEIKRLSIKYGIINEYISMLILEDEPPPPGVFEGQFAADTGKAAVDASAGLRSWKEANVAPSGAQSESVKIVGSRIFVNKDEVWTDVEYQDGEATINLLYASDSYFSLVAANPDLGKYFALGNNVVFSHNGEFYRVQDDSVTAVEALDEEDGSGDSVLDDTQDGLPMAGVRTPQLGQNYPNPFNPETWVPFRLFEDSVAVIKIYDVGGRLIRKLELGRRKAGEYLSKDRAAYWDGRNSSGEEVSSGVYFYILETDNFRSMKKMTVKK